MDNYFPGGFTFELKRHERQNSHLARQGADACGISTGSQAQTDSAVAAPTACCTYRAALEMNN